MTTAEIVLRRPPRRRGAGLGVRRAPDKPLEAALGVGAGLARLRRGQHAGHHVHRQGGRQDGGGQSRAELSRLTLFLLIGTLVWAYMSAVLDDMSLVIMWERWEGTIEHTLMTPVPRVVHLLGMSVFGVLHGLIRTSLILACSLPFFSVDLRHADWPVAAPSSPWGASAWWVWASCPGYCRCYTPSGASRCRLWCRRWCCWSPGCTTAVNVLPGWMQAPLTLLAGHVPAQRHPRRHHLAGGASATSRQPGHPGRVRRGHGARRACRLRRR
jgi:hypothetical protein